MNYKRILSLLLLLCLLFTAVGCSKIPAEKLSDENDPVTLTLWVYPMGKWDNQESVDSILQAFTTDYPYVTIDIHYLSEETADIDVSNAIECGECPDLLFGSLSQLQHAQRRGGDAVDLADLCKGNTYRAVKDACTDRNGLFYALPAVMDVTCMAINYEMFRDADALQYIDEVHHTWTTENFLQAVKALRTLDQSPDVLALYCGGQSGDEGTRALVNNLYGGQFTDKDHTRYTLDSEENLRALSILQELRGVIFDENITSDDENVLFAQEQLAMSLCWNGQNEPPEKFTAFPMAYPSEDGNAQMPGEVWGFSYFDNGDRDKREVAKALLTALTDKDSAYGKLVALCGHYPVRTISSIQADDYTAFMPMMGSYDLYTPGFAIARTEWYELLQRLGGGDDVMLEVETFCTNANAAAKQMK